MQPILKPGGRSGDGVLKKWGGRRENRAQKDGSRLGVDEGWQGGRIRGERAFSGLEGLGCDCYPPGVDVRTSRL